MSSKQRLLGSARAFGAAYALLERQIATDKKMTVSQLRAIDFLWQEREGSVITIHQLAEAVGVALSTMTRNVKVLEREDWVDKYPGPNDKRTVGVRLTPTGQQLAQEVQAAFSHWLHQAFSHLHPSDFVVRAAALEASASGLLTALSRQ